MKITNWADLSKEEKDKGRLNASLIYLGVVAVTVFVVSVFTVPPMTVWTAKLVVSLIVLFSVICNVSRMTRALAEARRVSIEACKREIDEEYISREPAKAAEEMVNRWTYTIFMLLTIIIVIVDVVAVTALFKLWG